MSQERYYWLKAHGICVQCGQRDAFPGYTKCPECIEKAEEASRKCWADKEKRIRYNKRGQKRKTELLDEIPKSCVECPMCYHAEDMSLGRFKYERLYKCKLEPEDIEQVYLEDILHKKPDWCPIKIPKKNSRRNTVSK